MIAGLGKKGAAVARVIESFDQLKQMVGQEVGLSEWVEVTQERIRAFADATDDRQWIHLDSRRAQQDSPYRTTVAHGFLTLSLLSSFWHQAVRMPAGSKMTINYGLNRVRFPAPVPAGSRIRARFGLQSVSDFEGGVRMTWKVDVEVENTPKPCLVAEWVVRVYR